MRLLRVPGFAALLAGQSVNAVGNWVAIIAIWGFAAFRFDAGAGDLAALFVVLSVPGALLGPLLGVPIDRLGPRRTLVLANLLGVLDALALTQAGSYEAIIVLALPLGLIEALATASVDALPPRLVGDDDLVAANALLGASEDFAIVVGPVVAAGVNAMWGLPGAFAVDAATFAVGAAVAARLDVAPVVQGGGGDRSTWREVGEGARLAWRTRGLRWTFAVVVATYAVWGVFGVLEPLYVRDVLGQPDTTFALIQTVFGLGLVGAGLVLATRGQALARPRVVAAATVVSGAAAVVYIGTRSLVVALIGVFFWGACVGFFYAPAKTLLQRYTPVAAHGRILSINQSLEPLSDLVVTPLAALALVGADVRLVGVGAGAVLAAAGLVALVTAHRLGPLPPPAAGDPGAGTSRDAVALGGPAPG
ncbi:MAG TPA: MFS transporter [Acidimicrobiales bacterium]|nr:MFS transporter [Acidimicrobiales bacterium]